MWKREGSKPGFGRLGGRPDSGIEKGPGGMPDVLFPDRPGLFNDSDENMSSGDNPDGD